MLTLKTREKVGKNTSKCRSWFTKVDAYWKIVTFQKVKTHKHCTQISWTSCKRRDYNWSLNTSLRLLKLVCITYCTGTELVQTRKAQSERFNRVPEGGKKSQRDWSTSLKQARARHRHCKAKGLQGMTTHLGHCQSTKTTESHSQPYSTEPAD